jgi:DNA-binding transcriptional regulator YdaS (Cro superfamily)
VTIIFVAPNTITYRDRVYDPFFAATYTYTAPGVILPGKLTTYTPDQFVSVMGCTEQYTICVQQGRHCTPATGQAALPDLLNIIPLNHNQFVTVQRLLATIATATIYSSIAGIGPDALRLWTQVYQLVSPGLPPNQWQLEVDGWHETTLAKWQALTVEFASNPYAAIHYPKQGPFVVFPVTNATIDTAWRLQCRNQLVRNLGAYQNVSVVGLALIFGVGGLIIVTSWVLTLVLAGRHGSEGKRWAWRIDGKLQAQRVGMLGAGFKDLDGTEGDVPVLLCELAGAVPVRVINDDSRGGLVFVKMNARSGTNSEERAEEEGKEGETGIQIMDTRPTPSTELGGGETISLPERDNSGTVGEEELYPYASEEEDKEPGTEIHIADVFETRITEGDTSSLGAKV